MESHPKPAHRRAARSIKETAPKKSVAASGALSFPHIAELVTYGEISVGNKFPVGDVAIAHDGHNSLAMLRRRKGESLVQLLIRLDQAIQKALEEDIFTDEINRSSSH
jgi:hypothetical protein